MSGQDIVRFAEEVLQVELLPWQAETLRIVAHGDHRNLTALVHPNRRGKRSGIDQMQFILDEWKQQTTWMSPEVELAEVYRVAAKHLPGTAGTPRRRAGNAEGA